MRDWTFQQTISPAETFAVEYRRKVGDSYESASDEVSHVAVSEVLTQYQTFVYMDKDGKSQTQDVVANTISTTTTCVGAANPTRWKSKLEAGSPPYAGTELIKRTETFNEYVITEDGPVEVEVTTYEYEPTIAFAGGLAIEDYKDIDLGTGNVLTRKTIVQKLENKAVDLTKQTTTVYQAWGATSAGKTGASTIMKKLKAANETTRINGTYTLVARMASLVCSGTEQTINIGRGTAPAQPSLLDRQNERLSGVQSFLATNGPWKVNGQTLLPGGDQYIDLTFGSAGDSTGTYDLQFGPDSYLRPALPGESSDTGLIYVYGSNRDAAYLYGTVIHYILSGMANGKSITTELRNIPSEPMGTLYIEAAGTVGRFRANGTTFAWDSQWLVVGCDAMLDGGAGLISGASGLDWFPMMVPATNLPPVTATTNNNPALANTINAPNGFDPMAPGNIWDSFGTVGVEGDVYSAELTRASTVGAVAESVRQESVSRSLTWLLEVPYDVSVSTESLISVSTSFGAIGTAYDLLAGSGSGSIANLSGEAFIEQLLAGSGSGTIANLLDETLELLVGSGSGVITDNGLSRLRLNMDGANNSTTFTDSSANNLTVTPYGNAKISTGQGGSNGSSGYFDGSSYLQIDGGAWARLDNVTATIEMQFYATSLSPSSFGCLISKDTYGASFSWGILVRSNAIQILTAQTASVLTISTTVSTGQWNRIKAVNNPGFGIAVYFNNILVSPANSVNFTESSGEKVTVGCYSWNNPNAFFAGYIDDLSIY